MPIKPTPYKLTCPKGNYTKTIKPKSDVLNQMDMIGTCPKCKAKMEKAELNMIDKVISSLK